LRFLRRIIAGSADKSYGIHVARLAGLPTTVTKRARKSWKNWKTSRGRTGSGRPGSRPEPAAEKQDSKRLQLMMRWGSLFAISLSNTLLGLDVMTMTPLEAMNELYKLQKQAKKEAGQA
jgi:DNA mismatch repair protein MutS